ncbi:MAG TPA: glutamine-hydrolyzing carbamoyl-phosphate synthase small subunit [Alphaproteobacteria bacterium]|nr:glutamine-hydrolyzing carbamoyl-phosphate synthase small subunit [Alphaproteobacteria bacterium]HNS44393.1 glutamine-hydrolyzing carbamoyl-phosphate synthase small subunit [Alphaproteobacteria bacterium]
MTEASNIPSPKQPPNATAAIVLSDGTIIWGRGFGAETTQVGEICFNTSLTGYQEIMTDPSYAGQIITFTFPHIGNVGVNAEDIESINPAARGMIVREDVTNPSNWRSTQHLDAWLKSHAIPGICGVDTRALTRRIRDLGAPNGVICVNYDGQFDIPALQKKAAEWSGLDGLDLAKDVTCTQRYEWTETLWTLGKGYGEQTAPRYHVVAMDFGAKRNILRCLAALGCKVTVVPATTSADDILALKPDGVFLSNGPGDPAATGVYAVPTIKSLLDKNVPIFGICLGHQMLAIALGGKTTKMDLGHRGGNHPVKDLKTGKVEITSQNHGFHVLPESLPINVEVTHISLFDKTNEGIRATDRPAFSVQYHPEASPGPMDSHYLFERFVEMIEESKKKKEAA